MTKVIEIVYRKLKLESLEAKKLLAADVGLTEEGVIEIVGTEQSDIVQVSSDGQAILVHNGDDVIRFQASDVASLSFVGGDGDDTFINNTKLPSLAYGNSGNDTLIGGRSDDQLHGGPDDDVLRGRRGNDSLHGDYGNDELRGGRGNDSLYGWYGDDALYGGKGADYLSGYLGDDVLRGGRGNDVLKGHEGNDQLFGGRGSDELFGWTGDDLLVGGRGHDYLSGWSGNDILVGGRGQDELLGHSGNDILLGGRNVDHLDGGSGDDLLSSGKLRIHGDLAVLDQAMLQWNAPQSASDRIDALQGFIDSSIIADDNRVDVIIRDAGDRLISDQIDSVVDA